MSFDFFNTSHLAFGSKLTQAFNELEKDYQIASNNLASINEYLEIINQYASRNYRVPQPDSPTAPVRTNEIFDVFNDKPANIIDFYYDSSEQKVYLKILFYDKNTNLMTMAEGNTTIKNGYCYTKKSITNNYPNKTLSFTDSKQDNLGVLLFQYNVNSQGIINLTNVSSEIQLEQGDECAYSNISKGSNISFPYTATGYECICVVGKENNNDITLNGRTVIKGGGANMKRHAIIYLKKGDVVAGSGISKGFRIIYSK